MQLSQDGKNKENQLEIEDFNNKRNIEKERVREIQRLRARQKERQTDRESKKYIEKDAKDSKKVQRARQKE